MLDTCKVENVMNSWAARDPVQSGSDSSGNDTSGCGAVGALIFPGLLYADSCSKCFSLTLIACRVSVFHPVAFSDSWDCVLGSHTMSVRSFNSQLVARTINRLCLRLLDQ